MIYFHVLECVDGLFAYEACVLIGVPYDVPHLCDSPTTPLSGLMIFTHGFLPCLRVTVGVGAATSIVWPPARAHASRRVIPWPLHPQVHTTRALHLVASIVTVCVLMRWHTPHVPIVS